MPDAFVEATLPYVRPQVAAMARLQRLTGMRPGEVVIMRTCDLDISGNIWVYTPHRHKTEHQGRERKIPIGPQARAILQEWLRTDLAAYLFSPKEAMGEQRAERRRNRKTPMTPSQRARQRKRRPQRCPGDHYTNRSYQRAVRVACRRAGVPHWHPNQLRHNFATLIRKEYGVDTARAVLGHSSPAITEVYAERDLSQAMAAVERFG